MKIKWNKVLIAFFVIVLIILSGKNFGAKQNINTNSLDAEIVSNTAPATVNHYDSYTIKITVRNIGEETWKREDNIRLCIWQDNVDWGFRVDLPQGIEVKSGEEYTFELQDFVLPEAEKTILEFQMLKEGITYFGEREPVNIVAIE